MKVNKLIFSFVLLTLLFISYLPSSSASRYVPQKAQVEEWRNFVQDLILDEGRLVSFDKASDIRAFCKNYRGLADADRALVWAELFMAISVHESGLNPTVWLEEDLGIDSVTHRKVRSEGLLQLSYQDLIKHPVTQGCGLDWEKDQYLSSKDPRKTIFDPFINLRCGVLIMQKQIEDRLAVAMRHRVYWSTLRIGGEHSKILEMHQQVGALSICR